MTTPEEEAELFLLAKSGDPSFVRDTKMDARTFLIHNHLLFAMMQAVAAAGTGLPRDEVVSAANFAVMQAFERFDVSYGVRFTTYLRPFLQGAVSQLWRSKFACGVADPSISGHDYEAEVPESFENHPGEQEDFTRFGAEQVKQALSGLCAEHRELIRQHYVERMSFADIGRKRNPPVTREAVRVTHDRIIVKLRKLLRPMKKEIA